jgi:hypothetical protein
MWELLESNSFDRFPFTATQMHLYSMWPCYSQAFIFLPQWIHWGIFVVTRSAACWCLPGKKPGGDQGHTALGAEWQVLKWSLQGHQLDGTSRMSSDHGLSFQNREWSDDWLNSTCHCKIDLCRTVGNFTLKSARSWRGNCVEGYVSIKMFKAYHLPW